MFGFGHKYKKTAVLIIPSKQCDETEVHTLEKVFKQNQIKPVRAVSSIVAPITGMHNETLKPEIKASDINFDECDAVILIGGTGARDHYNDANLHRVLQKANQKGKIIGAIDYAPMILAHAEMLHHKCATVLATEETKLQASGAHYTGTAVEIDGNIITAQSSAQTEEFAEAIARLVNAESVVSHETGV